MAWFIDITVNKLAWTQRPGWAAVSINYSDRQPKTLLRNSLLVPSRVATLFFYQVSWLVTRVTKHVLQLCWLMLLSSSSSHSKPWLIMVTSLELKQWLVSLKGREMSSDNRVVLCHSCIEHSSCLTQINKRALAAWYTIEDAINLVAINRIRGVHNQLFILFMWACVPLDVKWFHESSC